MKLEVEKAAIPLGRSSPGEAASYLPADHAVVRAVSRATAAITGREPSLAGFPGWLLERSDAQTWDSVGCVRAGQSASGPHRRRMDRRRATCYQAAKIYASIAYEFLLPELAEMNSASSRSRIYGSIDSIDLHRDGWDR